MEYLSWLDETEQLRTFVKNGVRLDGRSLSDNRNRSCKVSTVRAEGVVGSSQVQLGGTIVSCGISLKVGTPTAEAPEAGEIAVCSCVLLPGCDPQSIDLRSKSRLSYELETSVIYMIHSAGLVDLTSLSIAKGQYAYKLCVNITCISNAGGLHDAVILAAVAALRDVRLPQPVQRDDTIVVNTDVVRPLALQFDCVPVSVGVLDGALIIDPTDEEERVLQGRVTCVFAMPSRSLCYLRQDRGAAALGKMQLSAAIECCLAQALLMYNARK